MFRRQGCSCVWSGGAGWMMSDRERGETDSSVSLPLCGPRRPWTTGMFIGCVFLCLCAESSGMRSSVRVFVLKSGTAALSLKQHRAVPREPVGGAAGRAFPG